MAALLGVSASIVLAGIVLFVTQFIWRFEVGYPEFQLILRGAYEGPTRFEYNVLRAFDNERPIDSRCPLTLNYEGKSIPIAAITEEAFAAFDNAQLVPGLPGDRNWTMHAGGSRPYTIACTFRQGRLIVFHVEIQTPPSPPATSALVFPGSFHVGAGEDREFSLPVTNSRITTLFGKPKWKRRELRPGLRFTP
jgi:hypothetical protein